MIERHNIEKSKILDLNGIKIYQDIFQADLNKLKEGVPINLFHAKDTPFMMAFSSIVNNYPEYVYKYLKSYLDIGIAYFKSELSDDDLQDFTIADEKFKLTIPKVNDVFSSFEWSKLYHVAQILNDGNAKEELMDLKLEKKLEIDDPFNLDYRLLQTAFDQKDMETAKTLISNLETVSNQNKGLMTGKEKNSIVEIKGRSTFLKTLFLPIVFMYKYIIEENQEMLNKTLEEYLNSKKAYIIKNKREKDQQNWIDFSCLSICSIAHDLGIEITVESEYIPKWVFQRIFLNHSQAHNEEE